MTTDNNQMAETNLATPLSPSVQMPAFAPSVFSPWQSIAFKALDGWSEGHLTLIMPDRRVCSFGTQAPGLPDVTVTIHAPRVFRRLVLGGVLAFAESYMDGDWSCSDLTDLFRLFLANGAQSRKVYNLGRLAQWSDRLRHFMNRNTKRGSRRNIAYHYDLGNDFYKAWLDASMTYSSAYQTRAEEPLEEAQARKYERVLDLAGCKEGHSVLEIGCGWGGLAEHAARRGARTHGVTLSREQLAYARARSVEHGFADKAKFELCDYRDTSGQVDNIISIEMIEAVGHENWNRYFSVIRDRLKPGGSAVIQAIVIADDRYEDYKNGVDFIQRYIFPGGMLPSPSALRNTIEEAGLSLVEEEYFGEDYAHTLAVWNKDFQKAWPSIAPLGYDERFRRMWEYYLTYCEAGFLAKSIDVGFFKIVKPA
ncbi:cyclopropane-fatty-acyl-phospholipid synthase family protein [Coralliovum pocilloporae]|uniref:cyclopropane-fatty-acyl-phospholipid synthase family protein n=1 Tax=Coralliovum pocilloporae TaxID=3066369 RepID=UPI0033075728